MGAPFFSRIIEDNAVGTPVVRFPFSAPTQEEVEGKPRDTQPQTTVLGQQPISSQAQSSHPPTTSHAISAMLAMGFAAGLTVLP